MAEVYLLGHGAQIIRAMIMESKVKQTGQQLKAERSKRKKNNEEEYAQYEREYAIVRVWTFWSGRESIGGSTRFIPNEIIDLFFSFYFRPSDSNNKSDLDALHRVNASELGQFVINKMDGKTLDRLWKHLDEDNSGVISRGEVLNSLVWMAVLYAAFRFRKRGGKGQPQIRKNKMKAQMVPVNDWILENKMDAEIARVDFKTVFGEWLEEYSKLDGYECSRVNVPQYLAQSANATVPGDDKKGDIDMNALHRVNASELGTFIIEKVNEKTLDRLWKHLAEDEAGHISREKVLVVLQWMSVLYVAFRFRLRGGMGQPEIDKIKMKTQFVPVKDWILETKMNSKQEVHRAEFRKVFGGWLKEYGPGQMGSTDL